MSSRAGWLLAASAALFVAAWLVSSCVPQPGAFCHDDGDCSAGLRCSGSAEQRGVCTYPAGLPDGPPADATPPADTVPGDGTTLEGPPPDGSTPDDGGDLGHVDLATDADTARDGPLDGAADSAGDAPGDATNGDATNGDATNDDASADDASADDASAGDATNDAG